MTEIIERQRRDTKYPRPLESRKLGDSEGEGVFLQRICTSFPLLGAGVAVPLVDWCMNSVSDPMN